MFKFLKDKISKWAKKVTEETEVEETPEEVTETKEEIKEDKKKTKKEEISKPNKRSEKNLNPQPEKQKKVITSEKKEEPLFKKQEPQKENSTTTPKIREETITQEIKSEETEKKEVKEKKGFFQKIASSIGKTKISEEKFEEYSEDLEMLLLENNVAFEVAEKIIQELKEKIVNKEIQKNKLEEEINSALKEIIEGILIEPFDLESEIKKSEKPYVILFCGINGTGKTTSIAKLSHQLKEKGITSILAAADTFRAASIEQLKIHGEKLGTKVIAHEYGSDPASVGFDAIKYAKKNDIDCVLIDTAGRMYTEKNLMKEIEKISRVCNPNKKIFVGESITGNDATEQVKAFHESIGINGIILSKADIDEKGGTALSVGHVTGKPIIYLGMGQEYKDLEKFDKKKFVEKLGL